MTPKNLANYLRRVFFMSLNLQLCQFAQGRLAFCQYCIFGFGKIVSRCRKSSHGIVTNKQDFCQFLSNFWEILFSLNPIYSAVARYDLLIGQA
jgi:hypothetical protein